MDVQPLRIADAPLAKTNFAGFDSLRAFAALGVVLLHCCVPYLQHPMPGLSWSVQDSSSALVDFGFWSIELFIMPLFLVLAGFLAWQTLQRRGPIALVKHRAKRLLGPLIFGMLVVLPLDLYSWLLGWVAEGVIAPVKLKSLKFDGGVDQNLWGLSHLWFLQYLFLYVVVVAVAATVRDRFDRLRRIQFRPVSATVIVLAIGSVVIYVRPEVVWGFQHSFMPVPSKWIYSGLFFAVGMMLAAHDSQLSWLKANSFRLVAPAICLAIVAVLLGRWHLGGGKQQFAEMTLAMLTCGSALMITLAMIGVTVKRVDRVPVVVSYLAAGSFWVYLVHHPIAGLVHLDLKWLLPAASPLVKTLLAFAITSGVSLLTYEGFVRRTALGQLLGFSWQSPATLLDQGDVISAGPSRSGPSVAGQTSSSAPRKAA